MPSDHNRFYVRETPIIFKTKFIMTLPKVLILNQPFVSNTGGGITMTNLFSGWDQDKLAVACSGYLLTPEIDARICNNYYQLGHEERKWIFPMNLISRKYPSGMVKFTDESKNKVISTKQKSKTRVNFIMKYAFPMLTYLGFHHFMAKTQLSSQFCKWLDAFKPDVIYAQCSSLESIRLCLAIQEYLKKPFVFHMMDDWPALIGVRGFMKNYWKKKVDTEFKRLLNGVDVAMAISDYMAEEYKTRYNKEFITFHNPINVAFWRSGQKQRIELGEKINIMYAGRIGLGIDTSLKTIASAIEQVGNELALNIELIVQAQEAPPWIKEYKCVRYQAFLPYEELPRVLGAADFMILPYDFSADSLAYIKFSMPTKAPEYMASGTPILIFAPKDTALVQYAENYKWASVVTKNSVEALAKRLKELLLNNSLRKEISETAKTIAEERHDDAMVAGHFREVLRSVVKV